MREVWSIGLLLATSMLIIGAGPNSGQKGTRIEGAISAIDAAAQQIVVADVVVQVTPNTIILMGTEEISFEDLKVGMTVVACGTMEEDVLRAHKITVKYKGK